MNELLKDRVIIDTADETPAKKHISLERRSTLLRSSIFILGFCLSEIIKQMSNFWLTTSYSNSHPIPVRLLIVFVESMKLFIISVYLLVSSIKSEVKFIGFSFKFIIPASCYFLTNLCYLYALTLTSPPIWMVLIQTRVLYTALIYVVVFKKSVTPLQVTGCTLIVLSIYGTRLSEIHSQHLTISLGLVIISQLSSALSSIACVIIEITLKNDCRNFSEQQFWLYFWGTFLGIISLIIIPRNDDLFGVLQEISESNQRMLQFLFVIVSSTFAGLCVPCIVRNLDSIAKDYVAALNNILLAIITATIFPTHFQINYMYGIALIIVIVGILFYERKTMQSLWNLIKCK